MSLEDGPPPDFAQAGHRGRAHRAWKSAETIKGLSDRLVGIGPFGLGLDGVLSWVPGVGPLYSLGAGGLLLFHAVSARASLQTLARMLIYVAADTATDAVPIAGSVVDMLFPGHLMAARALQKDIEARHGPPDDVAVKRAAKSRKKGGKG